MHKKIIGPLKNIHDNDLSFCVITVSSNILSEYKYLHFLMHAGTDWILLSNPIQLSTQERESFTTTEDNALVNFTIQTQQIK